MINSLEWVTDNITGFFCPYSASQWVVSIVIFMTRCEVRSSLRRFAVARVVLQIKHTQLSFTVVKRTLPPIHFENNKFSFFFFCHVFEVRNCTSLTMFIGASILFTSAKVLSWHNTDLRIRVYRTSPEKHIFLIIKFLRHCHF